MPQKPSSADREGQERIANHFTHLAATGRMNPDGARAQIEARTDPEDNPDFLIRMVYDATREYHARRASNKAGSCGSAA